MNLANLEKLGFEEAEEDIFVAIIKDIVEENKSDEGKLVQLYESLCNKIWYNENLKLMFSCSWRAAGRIVSSFENNKEYLDYYCSGNEGMVVDWIKDRMKQDGWFSCNYDN